VIKKNMNFANGQMVKSKTSDQVYRIVGIDSNIYKVEHGIDGEISHGCDDDFLPLKWNDPVYSHWLTTKLNHNYSIVYGKH